MARLDRAADFFLSTDADSGTPIPVAHPRGDFVHWALADDAQWAGLSARARARVERLFSIEREAEGIALARQLAMTTYRTAEEFNDRFDTTAPAAVGGAALYYLSDLSAGVTGTETVAAMPADAMLSKLKSYGAAPALLGFGISKPEHVKAAIESGAAGAISGSAIVQIIEKYQHDKPLLLQELGRFVAAMKAATQG